MDGGKKRLINKLVHSCMIGGEKTKSRATVSKTFSRLSQTTPDVITLLAHAIENVKPTREVEKVRIAGTTHNVPKILAKKRQETLAFRWIVEAAVKRRIMSQRNESFDQCLSAEIPEASQKRGSTRKRRDDLHKLAEANRSFAHYRWW
uniref:Ribosomal protein S7 n=1 Tax=Ophioglossum californicum TaxID=1267209 RepID=A0A1B3TRH0_9MONI|nr:ribosomal protein S7 [Ophioglossum californicum]YP_010439854.1 ribosomal protein S7 [Ophioglossum vulgatum]AOH05906.1 ribosomal protein S7 [Ophioglossum californicum]UTD44900.1 ribosomal protein S7 [Ophioglossum vulgatum]